MTNYNELSDFEINKRVAKAMDKEVVSIVGEFHPLARKYPEAVALKINGAVHDYCNNPADAWPIIIDNGISIKVTRCPSGSGFVHYAESYCGKYHTVYMDPLRAAMIVFLMMEEEKVDN